MKDVQTGTAVAIQKPTARQIRQERAVLYPLLADTAIGIAILVAAFSTGSLTLVGEGMRVLLLVLAGYWSLWCLMNINRGRLSRYEFGTLKLECLAMALCGVCLLVGGLFLCGAIVSMLFTDQEAASPLGLMVAALVNAVNVLINMLALIAMLRTHESQNSQAFEAQLRVRWILLVASLGVQFTLTCAAMAKDAGMALVFDALGASFVATLMIARGIGMLSDAMPSLVDFAAPQHVRDSVQHALATIFPDMDVLDVRTRTVAGRHHAEVTVNGEHHLTTGRLSLGTAAALRILAEGNCPVDLKLVAASANSGAEVEGGLL